MLDNLGLVARPEGVHNSFMDKSLVCLSVPDLTVSPMYDPEFVANLPVGCRGQFRCLADYLEWDASHSRFSAFAPAHPHERVYFISADDGPVKIGLTNNPEQRLEHLQTGSPYRLKLLAVIRAGRSLERAYHSYFDGSRLNGEWFARSPDLMGEIAYWSAKCRGTNGHSAAQAGHNLGHIGRFA